LVESDWCEHRKSRGTIASPIAVTTNDKLGGYTGIGYNGVNFVNRSAEIAIYATEPGTTTTAGGEIRFMTTTNGSTVAVNRCIVRNNGQLDVLNNKIIQVATPTVGTDAVNKTYADAIQTFSINRANHTGTQLAATVSDFTEAAQDAVGNALLSSSSITFTYPDVSNQITAALTNTGVTAATYGNASNFATFTVDAQGRITAAQTFPSSGSVFGQAYQDFSDTTLATTTTTAFTTAASFTTTSLANAGDYRLGMFWSWSISSTANDARFRVLIDGAQQGPEMRLEHSETANQSIWEYGFFPVTLGTGTHTLVLEFAAENAGTTVSCQQVFAEFWRVS
jgi:hypothetical protein